MKFRQILSFARAFEISGSGRMLPLEGLRAIAVTLVFIQHDCVQFIVWTPLRAYIKHCNCR